MSRSKGKKTTAFIILLLSGWFFAAARDADSSDGKSTGYKYFTNYSRKDYRNQSQNWAIVQDPHGVIYVGNHGALLEFDGVSWREFNVPNKTVRSIAVDDTGTLYIGGKNEMGFFAPDAKGTLTYTSLTNHVNENQKNFSNVWNTHAAKDGIYFETPNLLFRWASGRMKVWEMTRPSKGTFYCGGRLFLQQDRTGLLEMKNDSLHPVPGGEAFSVNGIFMIVPFYPDKPAAGKYIIGVKSEGFYILDNKSTDNKMVVRFPTEADEYLDAKKAYHGIRLASGDLAAATLLGGLVVLDSHGRLKHIFDKPSGLQNENVKYVFEDTGGNLWLALEEGLSKIEYDSPFSLYDSRSGLPGIVLSLSKFRGNLFVGTTGGLYTLTPGSGFRPLPGCGGACWSLIDAGHVLAAASGNDVFTVAVETGEKDGSDSVRRVLEGRYFTLLRSKKEPDRIWAAADNNLAALYLKDGRWTEEYRMETVTRSIRTLVEEETGSLWLGTLTEGVLHIEFSGGIGSPVTGRYGTSHGLPPGEVKVFAAAGHVMFGTQNGIYRFDRSSTRFLPDITLGEAFADGSRNVFQAVEDRKGNIWFHSGSRNFQAVMNPGGTYTVYSEPFLRVPLAQANVIYPEPGSDITWFGGVDGLTRYDAASKKNYDRDFPVLIRSVIVNGKSSVFDGIRSPGAIENAYPIFAYKDRNLRFRFAAPFFEDETGTRYRCFLEGGDDGWSDWTPETQKDYTNLDPGDYTFHVQARNIYNRLSREDSFSFRVTAPWYHTWWAIVSYGLLFFLLMYCYGRRRSHKLEREKERLEQTVKERTVEIDEKNRQLEAQAGKLLEMDRIKSRFFANISHEFRTPLTLIMGPLEKILSAPGGGESREEIAAAYRNSRRLLSLINQLLDLSRLESGKMTLRAAPRNIVSFTRSLTASFDSLAAQQKLELVFHASGENIILYFDAEKVEKILANLLSNAFKFTPSGGRIIVTITGNAEKGANFPDGYVEICVSDTGPGIPAEQLPYIFDRFYQVDGTHEHKHKGSGIGLALSKELVSLHYGEIDVQCGVGENHGAAFIVRFPLGDGHFKPGEKIDETESLPGSPAVVDAFDAPASLDFGEAEDETVDEKKGDRKKERSDESPGEVILVVDDSADVRRYIRHSLESIYIVEEAADGREAAVKAGELIPDLVICDVMMPEVDGYRLCRELKTDIRTSHIPVILLTAKASEEDVIEGLETGADDYITKPFNTRILMARVKNLIELRRQTQLNRQRRMALQPAEISVTSIDETFYKELQDMIEKHLSDPEFNVEQLSRKLYMGRTTLYRKILALTGETPNQFIRLYRLRRAMQLLKARYGNVTEVAFAVGFSSTAYFTRCFKEMFHQLPSDLA